MGNFEYLTKEKFEELKNELEILRTVKRKEVAENLEYAKGLGDISENAEYHEAREMQANLEDRISKLENVLKSAVIVSDKHGSVAGIGSIIKIKKGSDKDNSYRGKGLATYLITQALPGFGQQPTKYSHQCKASKAAASRFLASYDPFAFWLSGEAK